MAEVNIQKQLKDLIEGTTMNWTYAIVWRYSSDIRSGIKYKWHGGYCKLLGTGKKTKEVRIFASSVTVTDEEVTDAEWFFEISMAKSFLISGDDLPEYDFFLSGRFIWLTGSEELSGSQRKRAKQAQEHGIQTLLLIPIHSGVMELGSTQIIPFEVERLEEMVTLCGMAAGSPMKIGSMAQTWEVSETPINDGHHWKKYDQREIPPIPRTQGAITGAFTSMSRVAEQQNSFKEFKRSLPRILVTYYGRHNHREARSLPERADDEMQNRGHDNIYKQSRGKEKISESKCPWPLLTESSGSGTDSTFSYSHEYSSPS